MRFYSDAFQPGISFGLCALGVNAVMRSQSLPQVERKPGLRRAAWLFGAIEVLGLSNVPWSGAERLRRIYEPALALLRGQLDPQELDAAWAAGAAAPIEEAVKVALEEGGVEAERYRRG